MDLQSLFLTLRHLGCSCGFLQRLLLSASSERLLMVFGMLMGLLVLFGMAEGLLELFGMAFGSHFFGKGYLSIDIAM